MSIEPNDYHQRAQQHRPKDNESVAREVRRLALLGWRVRDIASVLHLHPHLVVLLLDRVSARGRVLGHRIPRGR